MARIKIKDLPKDQKITKEELKRIYGGLADPRPTPIFSNPLLKWGPSDRSSPLLYSTSPLPIEEVS